jgi:hypothetical protein
VLNFEQSEIAILCLSAPLFSYLGLLHLLTFKTKIFALFPFFKKLLVITLGIIYSFFFFFPVLGLKLRAYTLSHSTSPFFCDGLFNWVLNYLPQLASNHDPPDLCLLSS